MTKPEETEHILRAIANVACQFLNSEMGVRVKGNKPLIQPYNEVTIKPVTAMMSISGCFSLDVTFSFDSTLIEQVFSVYCHEIDISDEQRNAYIGETACDVINIVIGNSTELLAQDGTTVIISVPKVIKETASLVQPAQVMLNAMIETEYGELVITAVSGANENAELFGD